MNFKIKILPLIVALAMLAGVKNIAAQGTAFTYQGRLDTGTNPVTGLYDIKFTLYSASTGGSIQAGPVTNTAVPVTNGLFTTVVDFGSGVFTGEANWLQIGVETNGISPFNALSPRQQLTPTPNAIYSETGNAGGLSGTIPAGDLSGVSGTGLTGVALLAGGNTFSGNETIDGMLDISDGASASSFTDLNIGPGGYYSGEEHSINFNDSSPGEHIGSIILGYNGSEGYFSFGNLYDEYNYKPGSRTFTINGDGNINIDPQDLNAGFLNNGTTNSSGLTFGKGSGEGIASDRTAPGNQYGLDFYTDFAHRMNISQAGLVGIGLDTNKATQALEIGKGNVQIDNGDLFLTSGGNTNTGYGLGYRTGLPGISAGNGPFLYGYNGGALGGLEPTTIALSWDFSGDCWVSNNLSVGSLTMRGEYLVVDGLTPVDAYIGDDGFGNDVQIGSQKSGITALACYNTADNAYMHVYCSSITIEGGSDLAEPFKISSTDGEIPEGAVVVIDDANPGHLKISDQDYDTHVAGVVSGANGIHPGIQMQQQGLLDGGKNVALTGRVYVQADASNGAIRPGDLLTTSSIPGHAMRVTDHARAAGAILGKAMTGLAEGKGMVLVLVTLQ
jgi:hypothetical protein